MQSSITVSSGQLSVSAPYISDTVKSGQVTQAFVVNMSEWTVTISSKVIVDWEANGYTEGIFVLSNGARANVATDSSIDLVIVASSGQYLILAPDNFQAFVADFSSQVSPVANTTA